MSPVFRKVELQCTNVVDTGPVIDVEKLADIRKPPSCASADDDGGVVGAERLLPTRATDAHERSAARGPRSERRVSPRGPATSAHTMPDASLPSGRWWQRPDVGDFGDPLVLPCRSMPFSLRERPARSKFDDLKRLALPSTMTESFMRYRSLVLGLVVGSAAMGGACNEHVFRKVELQCTNVVDAKLVLDVEKPADILIVVDNSGSMCEEQDNLAKNFFDPACPLTDLNNIPAQFKNPNDETIAELSKSCGFIQMLAAFDNDFHVGVITSDTGLCDNRFGEANGDNACGAGDPNWGRRPQRGCLQKPPGEVKTIFSRGDTDIGVRFQATLQNIRTFGSSVERELDAAQIFLDPASERAPGCEGDRDAFFRDGAKLSIIFLSDEEDCSHDDTIAVDAGGFGNENAGEQCVVDGRESAEYQQVYANAAGACYNAGANLKAVSTYVDFFKGAKANPDDVQVAVIAGGLVNDRDGVTAGGCIIDNAGEPSGACIPLQGKASQTVGCGGNGQPPCCTADPGTRYIALAQQMGQKGLADSICRTSFRDTMIKIAQFVGRTDFVTLSEAPSDPKLILVTILRAGSTTPESIRPVTDCTNEDGWQLDGLQIRFCGNAGPKPGDELNVQAALVRASDDEDGGVVGAECQLPTDLQTATN